MRFSNSLGLGLLRGAVNVGVMRQILVEETCFSYDQDVNAVIKISRLIPQTHGFVPLNVRSVRPAQPLYCTENVRIAVESLLSAQEGLSKSWRNFLHR